MEEGRNMNHEVIDFFEKQLERVDKWLHYAEAKNGALMVFYMAILSADKDAIKVLCKVSPNLALLLPIFITLLSFLPKIKILKVDWLKKFLKKMSFRKKKKTKNQNLIFFYCISRYPNEEEYAKDVLQCYFKNIRLSKEENKQVMDLAYEIYSNSIIANRKFNYFRWSLKVFIILTILYLLEPFIPFLILP